MKQRTMITMLGLGCAALFMSGCAPARYASDDSFGDAVRTAQAQQTVNPDAPRNAAAPIGLNGAAAKATVDRYQKSFETPPPPVNVFTIGVGGSTSSGGTRN